MFGFARSSREPLFEPGAKWQCDEDVTNCPGRRCGRRFSFLLPRHHCRWCGGVYCDACAPRTALREGRLYRRCNRCRLPFVLRGFTDPRTGRREAGPLHCILSFLTPRSITALLQSCHTMLAEFPVRGYPFLDSIQTRFPSFYEGAQIGKGSFGTVYKCEDRSRTPCRRVAIKRLVKARTLTCTMWNKTLMELQILHEIAHPNVAALLEVFQTVHDLVIVMEAGDGGTLGQACDYVRKHHLNLLEPFVASVVLQVANGLDYLYHQRHIIHRDIKFENIVLSRDYATAMIIDFGLAEFVRDEAGQRYVAAGTAGYASPENIAAVAAGQTSFVARGETMHRGDLFSLGVVAHIMLTLHRPLRSSRFVKQYAELQEGIRCRGPYWDAVSPALGALVERLLSTDAATRPCASEIARNPFIVESVAHMPDLVAARRDAMKHEEEEERTQWVIMEPDDRVQLPVGASLTGGDENEELEQFPSAATHNEFQMLL